MKVKVLLKEEGIPTTENKKTAKTFYEYGEVYFMEGDFNNAIKELNEAIKLDTNLKDAYSLRAEICLRMGQYDQVILDYSELIRIEPYNFLRYIHRGDVYFKNNHYDQAIGDYNEAIRLDPEEYLSYMKRGLTYYEKGQYDQTLSDFNKVINIGIIDVDDMGEIISVIDKMAEQSHTESQYYLGNCYLQAIGVKQDFIKAAEWWQKAAANGHKGAKEGLEALKRDGYYIKK
jgi:tetratricopeptide (TPR) repeat protein